jgi:hypothetical protein
MYSAMDLGQINLLAYPLPVDVGERALDTNTFCSSRQIKKPGSQSHH